MSDAATRRTANLLGALALGGVDRMTDAVEAQTGLSASGAAALSALDQFLGSPSVDQLARVVGLSQSGGVRLVDRLERDGLVGRGPGADGRTASVALTAKGRRAARAVASSRLQAFEAMLSSLDPRRREQLADLVGRLLAGMMREPGATRWGCRMCDLGACGRPLGTCPVEQEARRRYGDASDP